GIDRLPLRPVRSAFDPSAYCIAVLPCRQFHGNNAICLAQNVLRQNSRTLRNKPRNEPFDAATTNDLLHQTLKLRLARFLWRPQICFIKNAVEWLSRGAT